MTDYSYEADYEEEPPSAPARHIRFDPTRTRERGDFNHAHRHSRRVGFLKLLLPTVAVAGVAGFLVLMLRPAALQDAPPVPTTSVDVETRSVTMDKPRISGFEGTRRAYEVVAERAVQDLGNPRVMRLETIRARFGMGNGVTAVVNAVTGFYDSSGKGMILRDGVTLKTSNGYHGVFEEAEIDVDKGTMLTTRPVTLSGKEGSIEANAMEVADGGTHIYFRNGVKVTYHPVDEVGDGEPATATPAGTGGSS